MADTWILEHEDLRASVKDAKKAFDKGFSTGKGDWNYTKQIGDLAMWVEKNSQSYVDPTTYGASHTHALGSGGYYGISLSETGDKSYDARAVFQLRQYQKGRYYLWVYALAMHNGNDIGGYQCYPKVIGGKQSFVWTKVSEGSNDGYNFFNDRSQSLVTSSK
jgi:hypothetical protein